MNATIAQCDEETRAITLDSSFLIRTASLHDLDAITRIWQQGVSLSLGYSVDCRDVQAYFAHCVEDQSSDACRFWVAADSTGSVIGWQSLRPTRANPAVRALAAESSTYVEPGCHNRGVGAALVQTATRHADVSGLHFLFGFVADRNEAVRQIARRSGWREVGEMPKPNKAPMGDPVRFMVYVARG